MSAKPGILTGLRVKRVALVDMGANFDKTTGDGAHIMLYKRAGVNKDGGPSLSSVHSDSPDWDGDDQDEYEKATLDGPGRRALPDSSFAAVWTDAQGKKHRKLPIHDAGHLAAARGRIDAADIPAGVKAEARRKIEAATGHSGHPEHKEKRMKTMKEILKGMLGIASEPDAAKRADMLKVATEAIDKLEATEGTGEPFSPEHVEAAKAGVGKMREMMKAFGPGPHPAGHPFHALKAAHDEMCKALAAAGHPVPEEGAAMTSPNPAVEKRITEIEKANADLQKRLDAEIEKGIRAEVTKTLGGFRCVPLKMEGEGNDVDRYVDMFKSNKPLYDRQIELFKATDAQLAGSAAFNHIGSGRSGGDSDAWARIEAEADKVLEKAAGKNLTKEQAIEKIVCDPAHASLVKQYREQQQ